MFLPVTKPEENKRHDHGKIERPDVLHDKIHADVLPHDQTDRCGAHDLNGEDAVYLVDVSQLPSRSFDSMTHLANESSFDLWSAS